MAAVLRAWVRREARKPEYPDADPDGWDEERLCAELRTTYDEPVQYATFRAPDWTTLVVGGSELGLFDPYPSIGWNWLTGGKRLAGAIDRMRTGARLEERLDFIETVARLRRQHSDRGFGAVVVRQYEEFWPPIVLDGNHRACAALLAANEGRDVDLRVHFGHETPLDRLPVEGSPKSGEPNQ